ncbi:tyrosine-type recombinase/integrase [Ectobacillus funiculus]|uniref:tyrosine-type recombinase/integrase n=1 Tax=Ectobacillus funiculus TaxID=137993 RepID=UPI00101D06DC|nr:tyrosine-type recombinase/integrase [Ectobacillus funiculus]
MLVRFLIEEFIAEKRYENVTEHSIKTSEYNYKHLEGFLVAQGIEQVNDITPRVAKRYMMYCKENGDKPTTLNSRLKRIKALFNWAVKEKIIEENPFTEVKKVREDARIHTFTDEEVKEIISYLRRKKRREDTFYAVRNYTAFLTLIGTGIRLGELVNLRWEDINFETGQMKVFGKARKEANVPIASSLLRELSLWRVYCEEKFNKLSSNVFVNKTNQSLTDNAIKCFFKRLSQAMEFPETRCSAHSCRHYYAKTYIQSGGDIVSLARILRHTSIKTTERYLHMFSNELKENNEKFNPLNKLF